MNFAQTDPDSGERYYDQRGYPLSQPTTGFLARPEPAMQQTVDAKIDATRLHFDDQVKLLKAELSGEIELLRRDVNDLRTTQQQKQQHSWDLKIVLVGAIFLIISVGVGSAITWLLTK